MIAWLLSPKLVVSWMEISMLKNLWTELWVRGGLGSIENGEGNILASQSGLKTPSLRPAPTKMCGGCQKASWNGLLDYTFVFSLNFHGYQQSKESITTLCGWNCIPHFSGLSTCGILCNLNSERLGIDWHHHRTGN